MGGLPAGRTPTTSTLIITNTMKLAGLVVFVREAFTAKEAIVMGICAVMMAGVQALEQVAVVFIERFFATQPTERE